MNNQQTTAREPRKEKVLPRITEEEFSNHINGIKQSEHLGMFFPQILPVKDRFKKTEKERGELAAAKQNYKKLKENALSFKETQTQIVVRFIEGEMPRWGSFGGITLSK